MPTPYCLPVDTLRRFDDSLDPTSFTDQTTFGGGVEQARARIRAVSQDFDRDTNTPLRQVRVGSPGAPNTYEFHDADRQGFTFPLRVELDHGDVVPLDPDAGDTLEIREARDSWEDVTAEEGDEWILLEEPGDLKLFQLLVSRVYWEAPDERYVRITYRHGALGGGRDRGGETTVASAVAQGDTTISVDDASRLPYDGGVMLLYDPDNSGDYDGEYVHVTDVDTNTDELTVKRAAAKTYAISVDAGAPVHYCPPDVRDAVAAQAAAEYVRYDLDFQRTDGDDAAIDPGSKVDAWEREYDQAKARYSGVRKM